MDLIIITGLRSTELKEELNFFPQFKSVQCFNHIDSYISKIKNMNEMQTECLLIVTDNGFTPQDFEPSITVLNSIIRKQLGSVKALLITKNKKLYFCWKTFSEKNRSLMQEFVYDPFVTSSHIKKILFQYLDSEMFNLKICESEVDETPLNIDRAELSMVSKDIMELNDIIKDNSICLTGSEWSLVKKIEKLIVNQTAHIKTLNISSVKNKDLHKNLDDWERIYLINGKNPHKAMENQNFLLFLKHSISMKVFNKKVRIIETEKNSSTIQINSAKDFLTKF